jgi:hypothetical protein
VDKVSGQKQNFRYTAWLVSKPKCLDKKLYWLLAVDKVSGHKKTFIIGLVCVKTGVIKCLDTKTFKLRGYH